MTASTWCIFIFVSINTANFVADRVQRFILTVYCFFFFLVLFGVFLEWIFKQDNVSLSQDGAQEITLLYSNGRHSPQITV